MMPGGGTNCQLRSLIQVLAPFSWSMGSHLDRTTLVVRDGGVICSRSGGDAPTRGVSAP